MTAKHHFNASADECRFACVTGRHGIQDFLDLHNEVYWSLAHKNRHFLKKRSFFDLMHHAKGGHHLVGLYTPDNQMVAQALVSYPDLKGASNLKGYPIGAGGFDASECAVVQTLGVHPLANGKSAGYVDALLGGIAAVAEGADRPHLLAKMNAENERAKGAFKRAGYAVHGTHVQVAGESYVSAIMHKNVTPAAFGYMPIMQTQPTALTA